LGSRKVYEAGKCFELREPTVLTGSILPPNKGGLSAENAYFLENFLINLITSLGPTQNPHTQKKALIARAYLFNFNLIHSAD
jgi:hypothetical protein